ncbi:MAG: PAS domain-containing protein [Coleofasciculaceae cyanobacterium]
MSLLLNKLLALRKIEYLAVDQDLKILEISSAVQRFADSPYEVVKGKDIRLSFPELIGMENVLLTIIQDKQESFELKGLARFCQGIPLYIDILVISSPDEHNLKNRLVIFFEDVTERMVLEQKLVQRSNEASLLLEAWAYSSDYLDKIINSLTDILVITTSSSLIKTVNITVQDLLEYNEEELVGQPISHIFEEENVLHEANASNLIFGEMWNNVKAECQTKTGKKITIAFSRSAIHNDLESIQGFIYIGRELPKP